MGEPVDVGGSVCVGGELVGSVGDALEGVGLGVGLGIGFGVGFGVGLGIGFGVGFGYFGGNVAGNLVGSRVIPMAGDGVRLG